MSLVPNDVTVMKALATECGIYQCDSRTLQQLIDLNYRFQRSILLDAKQITASAQKSAIDESDVNLVMRLKSKSSQPIRPNPHSTFSLSSNCSIRPNLPFISMGDEEPRRFSRANRGANISKLLEQSGTDATDFWGSEEVKLIFAEEEETDRGFSDQGDQDSTDSDFDIDENEAVRDEEKEVHQEERARRRQETKKKQAYVDPVKKPRIRRATHIITLHESGIEQDPQSMQTEETSTADGQADQGKSIKKRELSKRTSVIRAREAIQTSMNLLQGQHTRRPSVRQEREPRRELTLEERLEEAKDTERHNRETLRWQKLLEDDKKKVVIQQREINGPLIRYISTTRPKYKYQDRIPFSAIYTTLTPHHLYQRWNEQPLLQTSRCVSLETGEPSTTAVPSTLPSPQTIIHHPPLEQVTIDLDPLATKIVVPPVGTIFSKSIVFRTDRGEDSEIKKKKRTESSAPVPPVKQKQISTSLQPQIQQLPPQHNSAYVPYPGFSGMNFPRQNVPMTHLLQSQRQQQPRLQTRTAQPIPMTVLTFPAVPEKKQ
ncbi:putative vacuolar protein sorting-associated protein 72 [Blattamonas nauphoetae]|uniref:Vacuolar protein sorting-associated protein 72 n=1 Tax=Blattamonas nauphoetae TaxID=2049346 RepID=A0ABQ9XAP9_9EUKA|nr:putative vacuolar protein sorting-associated protein 72 [Blattamonas nauphoetae]